MGTPKKYKINVAHTKESVSIMKNPAATGITNGVQLKHDQDVAAPVILEV